MLREGIGGGTVTVQSGDQVSAQRQQQGRPNPETGCWPAEERNRHVLLPLSMHSGITMHRGGSFRFERGTRKHDEIRRHPRLLQSSACDWWGMSIGPTVLGSAEGEASCVSGQSIFG